MEQHLPVPVPHCTAGVLGRHVALRLLWPVSLVRLLPSALEPRDHLYVTSYKHSLLPLSHSLEPIQCGITVTLPKPPCRSVCDQVVLNCNATFALYGVPLPNCTAVNPINGLEVRSFVRSLARSFVHSFVCCAHNPPIAKLVDAQGRTRNSCRH